MIEQHISDVGLNQIKKFEGLRLKAYLDIVGIPTIGYGTTMINGRPVRLDMVITESAATRYLEDDVDDFEDAVNRLVRGDLTQEQFDACVIFAYNIGVEGFRKSTLLKKINQRDFDGAQIQFLRWNKAGGKVSNGLVNRRISEALMFGPNKNYEEIKRISKDFY